MATTQSHLCKESFNRSLNNSFKSFSYDKEIDNISKIHFANEENDADSDSSCETKLSVSSGNLKKDTKKIIRRRRSSSNLFLLKKPSIDRESLSDNELPINNSNNAAFSNSLSTNTNFCRNKKQRQQLLRDSPIHSSSTDESENGKVNSWHKDYKDSIIHDCEKQNLTRSSVDGLLFEIYDRHHQNNRDSHVVDSDITECSTTSVTSVFVASSFENDDRPRLDWNYLETKETQELEKMIRELKRGSNMLSSKLVRLLKQRDRNAHKVQENFNILTALLQAVSQKRRVDTRIRFSFIPRSGKRGFRQWVDALKAVARIHPGIPSTWRKRTWLSLSEYFLKDIKWEQMKKFCFNDRRNPDDDQLDSQIVKDLHRTGCGWFFEDDTEEDRASLKRVLLGYARWNKSVGYCQGFNVMAALILQVMDGNEECALKVMIYLVDYVLPRNYFSNNLRALSVDMAVLRDLMNIQLPDLANLLHQLQQEAMDSDGNSGASYEPPLINMFTMQWFLTMFATCLPRDTVLRIWDTVLLEGSEVLLRVALTLWEKLGSRLQNVRTAPDYYMKMGGLIQALMTDNFVDVQNMMKMVYQMESFPWTTLNELREKYTYDIHPFTTFSLQPEKQKPRQASDDDDALDSSLDDISPGCLGFVNGTSETARCGSRDAKKVMSAKTDITRVSPGAYITDGDSKDAYQMQMNELERMRQHEKLDLNALRSQYGRMRRLQQKAMLVFNSDNFRKNPSLKSPPSAINHLFVDVSKVAPPRSRYRKASKQFPALKAPSKGVPPLKPNDDNAFAEVCVLIAEDKTDNPRQVGQGSEDNTMSQERCYAAKVSWKDKTSHDYIMNSTSALYQMDRSAIYPSNFKPFPHRKVLSKKNNLNMAVNLNL